MTGAPIFNGPVGGEDDWAGLGAVFTAPPGQIVPAGILTWIFSTIVIGYGNYLVD